MSYTLVIVESPAKCKKIEGYLGHSYKVVATYGHFRTIKDLSDIKIENNTFIPTYSLIEDRIKYQQVEKLRQYISKANEIIIATDDDREGEAIGWHICDLFHLPIEKTKRIIFHEITEEAIQRAIAYPQFINMNIVYAQQARQILDMLVGFTISPILWNCISKSHEKSLSAGRCQTPALRILYDHHIEKNNSTNMLLYSVTGYFTNLTIPFELNKQFKEEQDIFTFLEKCKTWDFKLNCLQPKKVIKQAPEPLNTSNLQQLASNLLHLSPKETMKHAQILYEEGYITYMRTDSKKYCNEFLEIIKEYITSIYGIQYCRTNEKNIQEVKERKESMEINDEKITNNTKTKTNKKLNIPKPQEAHECIRPVNINIDSKSIKDTLTKKTIQLYDLIRNRTLESCMSSAVLSNITTEIDAPDKTIFSHKSEEIVFSGWKIIQNEKVNNKYYAYLFNIKTNLLVPYKKIIVNYTITNLKAYYTEAKLVHCLEEKGIGRPSTFASLIDKLLERGYVVKKNIDGKEYEFNEFILTDDKQIVIEKTKKIIGGEKNKLIMEPIGVIVIEFLLQKFDAFFEYEYTKRMEETLDEIALGKIDWTILCLKCHEELTKRMGELKDLERFHRKIDENNELIIGKFGLVIKNKMKKGNGKKEIVKFIPVKKDLDMEELIKKKNQDIKLEDIIEEETFVSCNLKKGGRKIGEKDGQDVYLKNGKYGMYAQWGKNIKAIKIGNAEEREVNEYTDEEVMTYLEDTLAKDNKPANLIRELTDTLSIRNGKYGDYILFKKLRSKKPEFLKLNGFHDNYRECDKQLIVNWIQQTYKQTNL